MLSNSTKGVGLIELIVVIIVASLLAVIAIPTWYGDRNQFFGELDRLSSTLLFAQYTAMNRGINTYVSLDDTTNTYQVFTREAGGDTAIQNSYSINSDVFVTTVNDEIEFAGTTGLPLSVQSIFFIQDGLIYQVSLSVTGEVSISEITIDVDVSN